MELNTRRPQPAAGFTLVEVLVALLVVTIGLIGMAGIQAAAVKYTKGAESRNHAIRLSYDMLDRMRASKSSLQNGAYTSAASFQSATCNRNFVASSAVQDQADIALWLNQMACLLPLNTGRGRIQVGALTTSNTYPVTITIEWNEERMIAGEAQYRYVARAEL